MLNLKEFRSNLKGLPDLLNWGVLVDKGVLLNKDGSFTAAFYFRGNDLSSSTLTELAAVSAHANAALVKLGTGWLVHTDSLRIRATTYPTEDRSFFPDPTTRLIDAERRAQHETADAHFDNVYAMALTYQIPPQLQERITALFVDDDSDQIQPKNTMNFTALVERFKSQVADFVGAFSAGVQIRKMSSDELLTYLHNCLTGLNHPVKMPAIPMYLDAVLGSKDFYTGLAPRIGTKHIRVITLFGFPGKSSPGMLDALARLPFEYRWSSRFIPMDALDAEKRLSVFRRNWFQKKTGLWGMVKAALGGGAQTFQNGDAVAMAVDADEAVNENSSGMVRYGYYTSVLVIMADDAKTATENAAEVAKLLGNAQFPSFVEDINAVEAFLGSLPSHGFQNVRRPLLHSLNVADLLPLTAIWSGHEFNPCPFYPPKSPPLLYAATTGNAVFRLSLHVSDLGHFGIFGPPGGGKSTLLDLIIAQHFRYPNAQCFGFDLGYSMATLCEAAGGAHYDIGAEGSDVGFCPLGEIDTQADRTWAANYIEMLVVLRTPGVEQLPVAQQDKISHAIALMAEETKDLVGYEKTKNRTLTHFLGTVQDQVVKTALRYYTVDEQNGVLGNLLDAEYDSLGTENFVVFETSHLLALGEKAVVPVFMYLFRQIEKRVAKSIPTLIPIDEGFRSFGHPLAIERFKFWLETMRKENVAVGFATQNLQSVVDSPIGSTLIQATATKFMLPNPEAATDNIAPVYRAFGLNNRQIENLSYARQKQDYYVMNDDGRRMFQLGLGKVAMAFVGASGKDQMQHVRSLKASHGPEWVYHYLKERGVANDWADYWKTMYQKGNV
ncbi:type IV secretion/conjugal transfer VirB4 family ATPase [Massilia sp. MP_M2]|uniref:VirB4 family type IV secretion/conjugal transfer ATPase n=1 Tax=Massilia sp. MP_M2 TaxID=3071713 RepID=UPI00319DE4DE